jgi:DNA-binding NtrC family response regulator
MVQSILNGKIILAVDDEQDILEVLKEEILASCPKCKFDQTTSYETALEKLKSQSYDLVVLDVMGVRGFDLLALAVKQGFPVAILTAHALFPDALKRSIEMGARSYLPKEKLGEIVPFLEDVLKYEYLYGWGRLFENLRGFFDARWGEHWQKTEEKFWKEFDEKTAHIRL